MSKPLNVLIIEDSEDDTLLLVRELRRGGYMPHYRRVDRSDAMAAALSEEPWDVILSDHNMPHFSSTTALELAKASGIDVPFMIVSGSIGEEVAVRAMKAGAQDYLMKGNLARLCAAVERELQDAADRRARQQAEKALLAQQEDLRVAREIQQRLFPAVHPVLPGFDIAGTSRPAEATGGDYYDFIPMRNGQLGVVVGDVTGHGLGPAMLMADVRAYLRALTLAHDGIRDILAKADSLLSRDLGCERFITLVMVSLGPAARRIAYVNAGHPDGYIVDAQGRIRERLQAMVPALGLIPDERFPEAVSAPLEPGDLLLLMTDGVTEACSPAGEEFGVDRALAVAREARHRPAGDIVEAIVTAVLAFAGTARLQDDITVVAVKALAA